VPSAQGIIETAAASATGSSKAQLQAIASSPLVWLSADEYARVKNYVPITSKNRAMFYSIFQPVVTG
jgi:spermidine/putrescine transport system substrate-binding protein